MRSYVRAAFLAFSSVAILVFDNPISSRAATPEDLAKLDAAMAFWQERRPFCEDFLSKEHDEPKTRDDGTIYYEPCNDGDTILFAGLTCAAGDDKGCDTVKASQSSEDGRWWRSPKKLREKPPEGSETTFSNDHAQGVWAYIAETKDIKAFRGWTGWIAKNREQLGFIPRYCDDDRCGFKLMDCPMLDRLAVRLETGNPICDVVPIPPLPIVDPAALADEIVGLKKAFEAAEKLVTAVLPGAAALAGLNPLRKKFDDIMNKMRSSVEKLAELQSRVKALQRVATDSAGVVNRINSMVNDPGYSRHNVATKVFLLLKYGGVTPPTMSTAAAKVAAVEPENAYFEYVAHGPSAHMLTLILNKCRQKEDGKNRPRFQWVWERSDNDPSNPAADTMYWDCLFVAHLYKSGPPNGVSFPTPRALDPLFVAEQRVFDAAKNEVEEIIESVKALKDKPTAGDVLNVLTAPNELVEAPVSEAAKEATKIAIAPIAGEKAAEKAGSIVKAATSPTRTLTDHVPGRKKKKKKGR
jgi:hypothetical protein